MGCGSSLANTNKTAAFPSDMPEWKNWFGVLGCVLIKDCSVRDCVDFLQKDGETQVFLEKRAPAWTVLKVPTNVEYVAEAGKQVFWLAYFEDRDAYWVEHKESQKDTEKRLQFLPSLMPMFQNANPMIDMAGGYLGPSNFLSWNRVGKNKSSIVDHAATYATLNTYRLRSESAMEELYKSLKKDLPFKVKELAGKLVHVVLFKDGEGEMPGADPLKLHIVLLWKNPKDAIDVMPKDISSFLDTSAVDVADNPSGVVRNLEFHDVDHKTNLNFWGLE